MDWLNTLKSIAPAIAGVVGTPLAGVGLKMAINALGRGDGPKASLDALSPKALLKAAESAVMGADTEKLGKLKEANGSFEAEMARIGVDLKELEVESQKIAAADTSNARNMFIQMKGNTQVVLAYLIIIGFFAMVAFILYAKTYGSLVLGAELGILIGAVGAKSQSVVSFFFGTSKGSSDKNAMLGANK